MMNEEQLRNAFQAEYLLLQKVIEDFDGRVITIKAWSVTFSLVAIAGSFASHNSAVLIVSCVSALLFWFIEANWKTFQYAYYERSDDIEEYFRGENKLDFPFQIGTSWYKRWKSGGIARLKWIMLWPHGALAHVAVAALSLVFYLLVQFGAIKL